MSQRMTIEVQRGPANKLAACGYGEPVRHGDAACGDRENRRKGKRRKGLQQMKHSRGESSGDTMIANDSREATPSRGQAFADRCVSAAADRQGLPIYFDAVEPWTDSVHDIKEGSAPRFVESWLF